MRVSTESFALMAESLPTGNGKRLQKLMLLAVCLPQTRLSTFRPPEMQG